MFPFENLIVYQKALTLNQQVYLFLKENKSMPNYVKDQLGRASLSIMLNIAEGSGRMSKKDRRNFFVISRSSAFECAAIFQFLNSVSELSEADLKKYQGEIEEISKMLYTMINNLEKIKK